MLLSFLGSLQVVVVCGPYTTTDSLMHEPLADLVKVLQKSPPDVCIMVAFRLKVLFLGDKSCLCSIYNTWSKVFFTKDRM